MDTEIEESLLFVDNQVFTETQKPLTEIHAEIFRRSWQGQPYAQISAELHRSEQHVKEEGAKLWKLLSQVFKETVKKNTFPSVIRRHQKTPPSVELERQYFWGESIDVSNFYGRQTELETLNKWIIEDRCRLIEILAMGGVGKTALAVKLAQQLPAEFAFVIWRSLRNAPLLSDLLTEIITLLSQQQELDLTTDTTIQLARLIHYLQQHRCLLIFDNIESILLSGSPRQYLAGYEGYGELFRQVAAYNHQSCLLLTSREQVAEVADFAGSNLPIRVLALNGLSSQAGLEVLRDKGIPLAIDQGQQLVDLYKGNPLALKIISNSILEIFDGQTTDFLDQGVTVFNGIRMLLEHQLDRLSLTEKQIMFWLAINREWVSAKELQADLWPAVALPQILESLEYLQGRSLIEVKAGRFTQQPVVMEYITEKLITIIRAEICNQSPQLFLSYALIKAQSKDYLRESQRRMIVKPLLTQLETDLGGKDGLVQSFKSC